MKELKPSYTPLFAPTRLGNLEVKNRFVRSATQEGMAAETGEVTDDIVKMYQKLARGDVGLIISGFMYVDPLGRVLKHMLGIHDDKMISGLRKVVESVHQAGGKMVFQLGHAGRQTTKEVIGRTPIGASDEDRDPINFAKPKKMTEGQIKEAIQAFGKAASRSLEAGVDGIQIHAGHGYLVNQFLSPFFNRRTDYWGGSEENRFRFLREVILETRRVLPKGMPILVKLSTNDYTPREGITPPLATRYAQWLAEMGIDGLELTCGSGMYSAFNMSRGEVPVRELMKGFVWWKKPLARVVLSRMAGKYDLQEGYNLAAAQMIKPAVGKVPVILVGGLRKVSQMEEILEKGYADLISMCRPFIREPFLVRSIKEGKMSAVSCVSCNKCLASSGNNMPVRCYAKRLPSSSD
jgi:2,4-dienoyl-CoA reductase-like NADH-dependent reductase (Old Yellow Enzyme family)